MKPSAPLLAVLFLVVLPSRSEAFSSIRCGSRLVSEGATQVELLAICGEPVLRNSRTEIVRTSASTSHKAPGPGGATRTRTQTEIITTRQLDEWTYNFGKHDFLRVVYFENGRLVRVQTGPYGY